LLAIIHTLYQFKSSQKERPDDSVLKNFTVPDLNMIIRNIIYEPSLLTTTTSVPLKKIPILNTSYTTTIPQIKNDTSYSYVYKKK
jgi:hypothetical protein